MNSLINCSVCGLGPHSIAQCRDPQIKQTWTRIFSHVDLRSGDGIDYLDDVEFFLEIEVGIHLIPAIGVQYAGSDISDSREDHITHILDRVRLEIELVNELSVEMRERYIEAQYPETYQFVPDIIPENIELVREDGRLTRSITTEIVVLCMEEPPSVECPICFEDSEFKNVNETKCKHKFCHSCLLRHMSRNMCCPLCREDINYVLVKSQAQGTAIVDAHRTYYEELDSNSDYDDMPDLITDDESDEGRYIVQYMDDAQN